MVREWKKWKREWHRLHSHCKSLRHRTAVASVTAVLCVWLQVITETPHLHHHSLLLKICLPSQFLVLRPTVYSFIYFFSTFSLPFLFCCRRAGSRILIWCYDLLLIGHLCFFHLSFPTNGTHFHTPCSLRPLPLVVLSACVSPAGPPLCLRLVQVKPQPLYHCTLHP